MATKKPTITKATKATLKATKKAASKASGKKIAAAMKKAGKGIFAPKKLSTELAAICGKSTLPRTEVTKKVWEYIKKNKLSEGRIIKPDAALNKVFPVSSIDMLKMAGHISKHLS